jgi:glycosyltransferase involved in cell wall biosynthesis
MFYNLRLMGLAFTPGNCRRLKELLRQHNAQVLHHVNHIFDTTFLTLRAAHATGVPVIGSITTPIQHENPVRHKIMALGDLLTVGGFGVQRWDGIVSPETVVHNEYVGKLYGEKAKQRSVVIPFGVPVKAMAQYTDHTLVRTGSPRILFVGHIHPFRNPVNLVRAMALVVKKVPAAHLVLAGRIDLPEPVRVKQELKLTDEQVKFLGETPHTDVVRLLKTSHVHASWASGPYRALGTAPMEAMLCETPVVNDLPENLFGENTLKDGVNIVLVDQHDPQSIANAIVRLLTDEEFRRKIGAGGRRFVLEHLAWDKIAEQMERFYERVIAEHDRKR